MSRASSEDTVVEGRSMENAEGPSQSGSSQTTQSTDTPSVSSTSTPTTNNTSPSNVDLRPRPLRDDTNRGKRLMGNLLGSLQGGKVRKNQPKEMTKSDIEERIRNRAKSKANTEESRALKETILRKRRERKALEMSRRHEQMRKDARFLQTQTKPMITFLPRVLTQEDSAQITEQCKGVEYDIQRELAERREEMEV